MSSGTGARSSTPTVIVARRARPGREREFGEWLERLVDEARRAPGFVGAEIQAPQAHDPLEWIVVYRFETADLLHAWIVSPERRALIADGDHLAEGPAREQIVVLQRELDPVTAVISVRVDPEHRAE